MEKIIDSVRKWFSGRNTQRPPITLSEESTSSHGYKSLQIQPTPNPQACQFVTNQTIIKEGTIHFNSVDQAKGDSFAEGLFRIFGIENVFIRDNFVTITKSPVVSWESIAPQIESVIEGHLRFYPQIPEKRATSEENGFKEFTPEEFLNFPPEQKEKIINAIFDYAIRPALANDGGDLELVGIKGNTIQICYQGACGTCPSSTRGTLQYIESIIKENLHRDLTVEAL